MSDKIIIDKKTYKLMCYTYRHHEVNLSDIERKFGRDGISLLVALVSAQYGLYRTPTGKITSDTSSLDSTGSFGLLPPGNAYIENRRHSFMQWIIPTIISVLALIASIAALIVSSNPELYVHLIK